MRHEYESRSTSQFDPFTTAFLAVILGALLFFSSFGVLIWNESRLNLGAVAQSAVDLSTIASPASATGKLVSLTGKITATVPLGDDRFLLPGNYVVVDRTVQMYAWKEVRDTDRNRRLDGTETQTTTYTYESHWTANPEKSENFQHSQNHRNPAKAIPDQLFKAATVQIGSYSLDMDGFSRVSDRRSSCDGTGTLSEWGGGGSINLPITGYLKLTAQNSRISGNLVRTEDYIFQGVGTPQQPKIGDVRVCYTVLPVNTPVTIFGQLNQKRITAYLKRGTPVYRLIPGDRATAIATLQAEHTQWTWIFRAAGFLIMWFGLMFLGSLFSALTGMIPVIGPFLQNFFMAGSLVTAFVLSVVTILVAMLLHHLIALLLAIGVAVATLTLLRRR